MEDANLVGNVYYGTYFVWQGRVIQSALYERLPEILLGSADSGELVMVQSRLNYLRDAMPFDEVSVGLAIAEVNSKFVAFNIDFYRVNNGDLQKLAVSQCRFGWRSPNNALVGLPESLVQVLMAMINKPSLGVA